MNRTSLHRIPDTDRIEGLHTTEGGHIVSGPLSFPLENNPLPTPEQVEGWVLPTVYMVLFFAVAIFCAIALIGAPMVWPFE
jgi:hypothetical protein